MLFCVVFLIRNVIYNYNTYPIYAWYSRFCLLSELKKFSNKARRAPKSICWPTQHTSGRLVEGLGSMRVHRQWQLVT